MRQSTTNQQFNAQPGNSMKLEVCVIRNTITVLQQVMTYWKLWDSGCCSPPLIHWENYLIRNMSLSSAHSNTTTEVASISIQWLMGYQPAARLHYCCWLKSFVHKNNQVLDNTFFTDEAQFHLCGYVEHAIMDVRFQAFIVVKIQVDFFWVVTQCSVVGYQCFRDLCCLQLHPSQNL